MVFDEIFILLYLGIGNQSCSSDIRVLTLLGSPCLSSCDVNGCKKNTQTIVIILWNDLYDKKSKLLNL